jgi:hypothetical protein
MTVAFDKLDSSLRRLLASPTPSIGGRKALLLGTIFALSYGFVMGTFSGLWDGRTLQLVYSAVKVPILLFATFAVALPSFFVLNVLAGVGNDFRSVLRALLATQAGVTAFLLSLAPFTFFTYAASADYETAILVNAACFGFASLAGQFLLRRYYQPLEASQPVHKTLRRTWLGIYAFIGIQAGWVLRPFIGQPGSPEQFFRETAWGNAYVELWGIVRRAIFG